MWNPQALVSAMSRQQRTPRRGSSGRGKSQRGLSVMPEEGYEVRISMPICALIDHWEGRMVNERLATGRQGKNQLIKNMMEVLIIRHDGNLDLSSQHCFFC